jgi:hypothetical protein
MSFVKAEPPTKPNAKPKWSQANMEQANMEPRQLEAQQGNDLGEHGRNVQKTNASPRGRGASHGRFPKEKRHIYTEFTPPDLAPIANYFVACGESPAVNHKSVAPPPALRQPAAGVAVDEVADFRLHSRRAIHAQKQSLSTFTLR